MPDHRSGIEPTPTARGPLSPAELFDLTGQVALVTGGSRGLGRAIALALARAGAAVAITGRHRATLDAVAAEIARMSRPALPVVAHAGRWEQAGQVLDQVRAEFGSLDVLVNNAGSSPRYDSLPEVSEQLFDAVFNLNVKGPFRLAVLAAEQMRVAGRGCIVNISSLSAIRPEAAALPYAAAKGALDVLTVGLAAAYAPYVRVNGIRPGSFRTSVSEHWPAATADYYAGRVSLGRLAEPDEIVGAVLYLACDAASFTTGSIISVDGGMS